MVGIQQLIGDGRIKAAISECDKALGLVLSQQERSIILQLKAQAIVAQDGKWKNPALRCLLDALELTEEATEERGRVLAACTAAYAGLHSIHPCRDYRDQFVALYEKNPTPLLAKFYPDVEYNLALTYHELERLDEAENAYLQAIHAAKQTDDPYVVSLRPLIHHNLVDIFQMNDRFEHAQMIMDTWYKHLPDDTYGAQMRNRRAIQALHDGDATGAMLWAESGLGHKSCDIKTRAALTLTQARILEAMGQADDAHDYALEAMRLAALVYSSRLTHRASSFIRQLSKGV
jgi:tetratricopeptide (TPR) repeat protein